MEGLRILPNPLGPDDSVLRLITPCGPAGLTAELFSLSGERVAVAHGALLDLSRLAQGVYLLRVEIREGSRIRAWRTFKVAVIR